MSISNYLENKLLDTLRNAAFSVTNVYVQLHLGDPGETGTANPAANTARQLVSFSTASGGSMASSAAVTWTNVPNAETYSHWSIWDAVTSGNCLWKGALTTPAVVAAGDTFQITTLTLTLE